jgi:uncharacterized protein involved in response to NO
MDIAVWMTLFEHGGELPSRFDPLSWHIHEMLFGFIMAAIAGFLLTAVANWTGRPPIRGGALGALAALWLIGRFVCLFSLLMPAWIPASVDLAFPMVLGLLVAKEVITARNWRNLMMIGPVLVLAGANLLMHLEAQGSAIPAGLGWRLAIAAILILLSAVAGRIVPAFTRNWLAKSGKPGPAPHGIIDRLALSALHIGALLWVFIPESKASGVVLLLAAILNGWRLMRWRGMLTVAEPLLLILHIGYAWLAIGVGLLGAAAMGWDVPISAALHSLTVGAMSSMILAVMTRATRGHTGRKLSADGLTSVIFILISGAAGARIFAAFGIWAEAFLVISAALWTAAFLGFLGGYGPILLRPNAMPS